MSHLNLNSVRLHSFNQDRQRASAELERHMEAAGPANENRRLLYLPVRAKYTLSFILATAWTVLCIWLSEPWFHDLAALAGWVFAFVSISFIAYVPGFMNAFLISTMLFDRHPPCKPVDKFPGVTVLVAAYNEESGIVDTLTSLARQDYAGPYEVLILNDGSTDNTAAIVHSTLKTLKLPPNASFRLLDFKQNRGKAVVLNDGLQQAAHDLLATVDGDSWVRSDGLTCIVSRLLSDPQGTHAVAGAVMVRNSRVNLLTRGQEWDYFLGIAAIKRMQAMYHGTLVAQGAFSVYTREALTQVGGWPDRIGEDIVLSWAMLKHGYRIGYAADAFVFTNVPDTVRQFARQRKRWSRGLMEAFKLHWKMLFKPRMSTFFIWWNVLFPPLDLVYTFVFIPGIVAALFGYYYIVGPLTLAVLPLAVISSSIIFRIQRKEFQYVKMKVRQNLSGYIFYTLGYSLLMQPACVWGYFIELLGMRKTWDTK
jgi:biofilm PGA synthesis N-glycosyltransferase PgaC